MSRKAIRSFSEDHALYKYFGFIGIRTMRRIEVNSSTLQSMIPLSFNEQVVSSFKMSILEYLFRSKCKHQEFVCINKQRIGRRHSYEIIGPASRMQIITSS